MSDRLSHWIHNNLGTNLWYRAGPEVTKKWLKTMYTVHNIRSISTPTIKVLSRLDYGTLSIYSKDLEELVIILSFLVSKRTSKAQIRLEDYFLFRFNYIEDSCGLIKIVIEKKRNNISPKF